MKESSCVDPRMAAYSQGICKLKTKFDGLELNHIPHRLNEAADALAKAASRREPTPIGVFARDQIKPAIHPKETKGENDPPIVPDLGEECKPTSDELVDETADVMDIEDGQAPGGMDQDWRTPYVDCLACCILPPPQRRLKQDASPSVPSRLPSSERSSTNEASRESYNAASPSSRGKDC